MLTDRNETRLLAAADAARAELLALTADLVRIPSENVPPGGGEAAVQRFIERFLRAEGFTPDIFTPAEAGIERHPLFRPGRDYAERPCVTARLPGTGGGRSLLLSGHADTVPAGTGGWTDGMFSGVVRDGRLFGRGAFDMKGGLACALLTLALLKRSGTKLAGDLHFESVVDEEYAGGQGTLACRLRGGTPDAAIVGENSGMTVYHAHRGFWLAHLTVTGAGGVDFEKEAAALDNPAEHLGPLLARLAGWRAVRRREAPVPACYRHLADPVPVLITKVAASEFSPQAPIAVPDTARVEVYAQLMPGETEEAVTRSFEEHLEGLGDDDAYFREHPVVRTHPYRFIPGSMIPADHPLVACTAGAASSVLGRPVPVRAAPYPCDLYILNDLFGIPGILYGPGGGNAHAPDEYVNVDDLLATLKTYLLTARRWSGPAR